MELEIINKTHKDVQRKVGITHRSPSLTVHNSHIYFSEKAVSLFGLSAKGKYIHLAKDKSNHWFFIFNDDNTGYELKKSGKRGIDLRHMPTIRLFMQSIKCKAGDSFYVQDTGSELNNSSVIEILTDKSVQKIKSGS